MDERPASNTGTGGHLLGIESGEDQIHFGRFSATRAVLCPTS